MYRDQNGAVAVSMITWSLFAAANLATVTYALTVTSDLVADALFALNALGCLSILGLTVFKRVTVRRAAARLA